MRDVDGVVRGEEKMRSRRKWTREVMKSLESTSRT